ncbi:hypothetical protein [Neorickettsia findlayensis]|uniref:Uncharacterized protein n=1 Tax=Neorickettsia findlayensis TaxID=2686014 RepID=A0A6P1GA60_9RICK|nr:hypothetical protein [Neorickettsia findlayensis]QHD65326.1 hypothetical protein GP480_02615 [Neorickettsia findlayensis]
MIADIGSIGGYISFVVYKHVGKCSWAFHPVSSKRISSRVGNASAFYCNWRFSVVDSLDFALFNLKGR